MSCVIGLPPTERMNASTCWISLRPRRLGGVGRAGKALADLIAFVDLIVPFMLRPMLCRRYPRRNRICFSPGRGRAGDLRLYARGFLLLASNVSLNFIAVGKVVREGGVNLFEFEIVAADRDFFRG